MRATARMQAISISISALHFLDWPVRWTHVTRQARKAGRELTAAFIAKLSAWGQSAATPQWTAQDGCTSYAFLH